MTKFFSGNFFLRESCLYEIKFLYLGINIKKEVMFATYTLDCSYYKKSFNSISALMEDVLSSGMDPNYEILRDGKKTGEFLNDLLGV